MVSTTDSNHRSSTGHRLKVPETTSINLVVLAVVDMERAMMIIIKGNGTSSITRITRMMELLWW
jgi:hypothetical protein